MDMIAAQAMVRFGLGAGSGAPDKAGLKAQLVGPDPGLASGAFAGLPTGQQAVDIHAAAIQQRKALRMAGQKPAAAFAQIRQLYIDDGTTQLNWALSTPAGYREALVWFWANHFSVAASQNEAGPEIGPMIREAIRPHVNGKFVDMVLAVERHPAMLRYLNNANSVGPQSQAGLRRHLGLNENLGRECMELHTVGLAAGYSQADVTSMAKILTGWSLAPSAQGGDGRTGFRFRPAMHEPGPQTVMGQQFDGGEQAGVDALTYLATYPTTYRLLARKLVTHFVADQPPAAAVAHIAGVLTDTGGDLAAAAAALVDLPAAWVPLAKLKTPWEYLVSMLRAAPPPAGGPAPGYQNILNQLGQPLWNAPLPNGWPDQAADWAGTDAIMARIDFAFTYASRFNAPASSPPAIEVADAALGPLLQPATRAAIGRAGTQREALTLLFASPEFQRR